MAEKKATNIKKEKVVEKKLTKFEKTPLFSARANEIAMGAKSKIKTKGKLTQDYAKIAQEEYEKGVLELEVYKK